MASTEISLCFGVGMRSQLDMWIIYLVADPAATEVTPHATRHLYLVNVFSTEFSSNL